MKAKEISPKKLVVFDIDDTLVHTQTKVHVVKDGEVVSSLNSHDFTHYRLKPGEEFDFSGFRNAREFFEKSKPIIPMMNQLKRDIATGNKVVMVTARADFDDRELFLDTFRKFGIDMNKVHVYRAGNSKEGTTEERKKAIIKKLLDSGNFTKAIMYDDAKPNLHTFMELKRDHPQTKFYAWHVSLEGEASEYMREDIMSERKKRRKRKPRWAAYGPGPYGGYGFDAGYSGDAGIGEFAVPGDDGDDPFDNYPCYDCGSTIFLHHTELCELAEPNAIRDLPSKPGSQHWTGEIPKGLHPIPGLEKEVEEAVDPGRRRMDTSKEQAGKEDLRKIIVDILERIYFDASSDDDMTDIIADQLGDYYRAVKVSGDAVLQRVYADMRDTADAPPEEQATVALAGIQKLMGSGYRPQPRPPQSPEQSAQVDAFVNQFKGALASQGIRAHPDWNKGKGQDVEEASYDGNVGMMEVAKFFKVANESQKKLFKELLEKGKRGLAWKLIQDVTDTKLQGQEFDEAWSAKYKRSINCSNPKGFSQRAHCQGRKKNENIEEGLQQRSIDKLSALGLEGPYSKKDLVSMSSAWSKTLSGVKSSQIMVQDTDNPRHSAWIAPAGGGQWMVGAEDGYAIKSGPSALQQLQFFLRPTNEGGE